MPTKDERLQDMIENNIWDNIREVFAAINRVSYLRDNWKWTWAKNMHCKYISVRIDMRDGGCILSDRNGNRISIEDLEYQYSKEEK